MLATRSLSDSERLYKHPNYIDENLHLDDQTDDSDAEDYGKGDGPYDDYWLPHEHWLSGSDDDDDPSEEEYKEEEEEEKRNKLQDLRDRHEDEMEDLKFKWEIATRVQHALHNNYQFVEPLSRSDPMLWVVYPTDNLQQKRILKISEYKTSVGRPPKEVRCLKAAQGLPGVPTMYAWHRFCDHYCIVMDYLEEKDLEDVWADPKHIKSYMKQLVTTLRHLYKRGIMHRDIKAGNVFWDGAKVTLIDYDSATFRPDEKHLYKLGTDHFMSPENFAGKGYNWSNDVYSLGVLFGMLLYQIEDENEVDKKLIATWREARGNKKKQRKIKAAKAESEYQFHGDAQARDLLRTLIQVDPKKRPHFSEILSHPYFK